MRPYDNTEDFFDPRPARIPRASRLCSVLPWLGAAVLIAIGAVCVFPYAGLAWLEMTR